MDIERAVAAYLANVTGIKAVLEVPDPRPDEFISVELAGGQGSQFSLKRTLAVKSWAQTRRRAFELASMVEEAVPGMDMLPEIFEPEAIKTYRFPDPDSKQERYQTTVELTVYE